MSVFVRERETDRQTEITPINSRMGEAVVLSGGYAGTRM